MDIRPYCFGDVNRMKIEITAPRGIMPKLSAKKLPDQNAQTAQNCDLSGGTIKPFKDNSNILSLGTESAWRSFFKWSSKYLYWTDTVDAVEIQEVSSDRRLAYTDGTSPKQIKYADKSGNGTPSVTEYRALGIQAPVGRPTAEKHHTWLDDPEWATAIHYNEGDFVKVLLSVIFLQCKVAHKSPTSAALGAWNLQQIYDHIYTYWYLCETASSAWTQSTDYVVGDKVIIGSALYLTFKATKSHLSAATTKPGVGASWHNSWEFTMSGEYIDSVSYVFTYVTDWGEESSPSLPTPIMDVYERDVVKLTAFEYMYGVGTVTVAAGSKNTITGSGTDFQNDFDVGDWTLINGQIRIVATIADAPTQTMTVSQAFDTAHAAGSAYSIFPGHLTYIRVYRLSSGTYGSQYQLVPYWMEPVAWVTATYYYVGCIVAKDDTGDSGTGVHQWFIVYECSVAHVSGATTEPGVGADWATKWTLKPEYRHFVQSESGMPVQRYAEGYWDGNFETDGQLITLPYTINLKTQGAIQTEYFDDPPDALIGLIEARPGVLAGFVGNTVYFSEPFMPYAWPQTAPKDYTFKLKADLVGLGSYNHATIAITTEKPVILLGMPGAIQPVTVEDAKAGTARRNIVSTPNGVMYAAKDGVYLVNDTGGKLLTGDYFTRKEFSVLSLANSCALFYDDKYILFFNNSNTAYVFDFVNGNVVTLTLVASSVVYATQIAESNQPLFLQKLTDGNYHIRELFGSSTNLTALWKSKVFTHKETALSRFQVLGEQTGSYPVTFTLSANGSTKVNGVSVVDEDVWPVGDGMWHETEMQVSATIEIASFAVASSSDELVGE